MSRFTVYSIQWVCTIIWPDTIQGSYTYKTVACKQKIMYHKLAFRNMGNKPEIVRTYNDTIWCNCENMQYTVAISPTVTQYTTVTLYHISFTLTITCRSTFNGSHGITFQETDTKCTCLGREKYNGLTLLTFYTPLVSTSILTFVQMPLIFYAGLCISC